MTNRVKVGAGKTAHTPGPWYAVGWYVETEDDDVADICQCNPQVFDPGQPYRSEEEICANAALIAQAPDLLERVRELEEVLEWKELENKSNEFLIDKLLSALNLIEVDKDGDGFICREAMEQVREAIAHVEGADA